jgi:putative restriction endonuclease
MLEKFIHNAPRLSSFDSLSEELTKLLIRYGPKQKKYHPEYPFWFLSNDGIWDLVNTDNLSNPAGSSHIKISDLIKYEVKGGFTKEIHRALIEDNNLLIAIVTQILIDHFPSSEHEELLDDVKINQSFYRPKLENDGPSFRERVLDAYNSLHNKEC